nr:helix-turn-helix domain-containing protein [Frankia sp. KB5]
MNIVTRTVVSPPAGRVVSQSRHRVITGPLQAPIDRAQPDVLMVLRAELQAVFERLDSYLANPPQAAPPPAPPAVAVDRPDPFEGLPALISVGKAAQILGLSRATAYRLADAGDLPTQRMGGRVYVVTARLRAAFGGAA